MCESAGLRNARLRLVGAVGVGLQPPCSCSRWIASLRGLVEAAASLPELAGEQGQPSGVVHGLCGGGGGGALLGGLALHLLQVFRLWV